MIPVHGARTDRPSAVDLLPMVLSSQQLRLCGRSRSSSRAEHRAAQPWARRHGDDAARHRDCLGCRWMAPPPARPKPEGAPPPSATLAQCHQGRGDGRRAGGDYEAAVRRRVTPSPPSRHILFTVALPMIGPVCAGRLGAVFGTPAPGWVSVATFGLKSDEAGRTAWLGDGVTRLRLPRCTSVTRPP